MWVKNNTGSGYGSNGRGQGREDGSHYDRVSHEAPMHIPCCPLLSSSFFLPVTLCPPTSTNASSALIACLPTGIVNPRMNLGAAAAVVHLHLRLPLRRARKKSFGEGEGSRWRGREREVD